MGRRWVYAVRKPPKIIFKDISRIVFHGRAIGILHECSGEEPREVMEVLWMTKYNLFNGDDEIKYYPHDMKSSISREWKTFESSQRWDFEYSMEFESNPIVVYKNVMASPNHVEKTIENLSAYGKWKIQQINELKEKIADMERDVENYNKCIHFINAAKDYCIKKGGKIKKVNEIII